MSRSLYCISATFFQGLYIQPEGPWTIHREQVYQAARRGIESSGDIAGPPGVAEARERVRFARQCAYLRWSDKKPDVFAGYSILIYDLDEQELREALEGPAPIELAVPPR